MFAIRFKNLDYNGVPTKVLSLLLLVRAITLAMTGLSGFYFVLLGLCTVSIVG